MREETPRNVDTTEQPPTVVSFCAGYGGIELGLERVLGELTPLAYVEIEAFAINNLVSKMEAGLMVPAAVFTDVKTFPARQFRGLVDILTAGFPCQPFSAAGKRGADDDPRHLFPYIKRSIDDMRPGLVLLENVEGIISAKLKGDGWADPEGAPVLLHVLRELERLGYRATAGIFSASEVGAPHQRKRVFILAKSNAPGGGGESRDAVHQRRSARKTGATGVSQTTGRQDGAAVTDDQPAGSDVAHCGSIGSTTGIPGPNTREERIAGITLHGCCQAWPSRPGEQQHGWEPPRVVADDICRVSERGAGARPCGGQWQPEQTEKMLSGGGSDDEPQQTQPEMGGNPDGSTDRMGYADLFTACDNRVDELRLLGNGVVPATAERAFRVLSERLSPTP